MIYNILLIVQILVALGIIGLVLIQHGKGADAGAAFGGGSSGTVFGSAGAGSFLSRATAVLAAVFFANSLGLAWIVSHSTGEAGSLVDSVTPTPTTKVEVPVSDVPGGTAVPQQAAPTVSDVPVSNAPQQSKPATDSSIPTESAPVTPVPAKVEATKEQLITKPVDAPASAAVPQQPKATSTPVVSAPVKAETVEEHPVAKPKPVEPVTPNTGTNTELVPAAKTESDAKKAIVSPPVLVPVVSKPENTMVKEKPVEDVPQ